ncbi:hypothetical protein HK405_004953, partial [Cladochytrium tenue]
MVALAAGQSEDGRDRGRGVDKEIERLGESVCAGMGRLFEGVNDVPASLLHGDLWGGNCGFVGAGEPVLFDPA